MRIQVAFKIAFFVSITTILLQLILIFLIVIFKILKVIKYWKHIYGIIKCQLVRLGNLVWNIPARRHTNTAWFACAIYRTDLRDVVWFFTSGPFGIFTATGWLSILDGTFAVVKAVTIANVRLTAGTTKRAWAFALRKSAMVYNTFTMKAVIATERNFAKGSSEPARITQILKLFNI